VRSKKIGATERARLVLGVNEGATGIEMKNAYHQKVLRYHPDRNKSISAERITSLIVEAYAFLVGDIDKVNLLEDNDLFCIATGVAVEGSVSVPRRLSPQEAWAVERGFYDFVRP
jgi:hypothetical protein